MGFRAGKSITANGEILISESNGFGSDRGSSHMAI